MKLLGVWRMLLVDSEPMSSGRALVLVSYVEKAYSHLMQPLRYSINVTLDGCCDHRAGVPDEELHRRAAEKIAQADFLLFGRVIYEMMEEAWRPMACLKAGLP